MKNYLLLITFVLGFGGKSLHAQQDFQSLHEVWIKDFNDGKYSQQFWEKGSLFLEGKVFQGKDKMYGKLLIYRSQIKNIQSFEQVALISHQQNNYFEMGIYKANNGNYASIVGWKKLGGKWLREIQILYPLEKGSGAPLAQMIISYAETWMKYSNAHDHAQLIEQVYSPKAVYVNGGRVDAGRKEIIDRYAYMSNPNWQIKLVPLKQLEVKDDIIFEIGRYESTGVGHYVIVWEKQESGKWQACLDFNF
ncbi:MAG: nuclear transport factor 2 family protein [Bacteroidota bacterium]